MSTKQLLLFTALFFITVGLSMVMPAGTPKSIHEILSDKSKAFPLP